MIDAYPQLAEQARTLGARSPLPMLATSGPEHVVRYVNPAFCTVVGQAAAAFVGSPLGALLREPRQPQDDEALALLDQVYTTGTAEFAVDLVRGSGIDAVQLRCAVWPILGADDRPGGLLLQASAPTRSTSAEPDGDTAEELRDVNQRLLVAGLKAQAQAETQIVLRAEAEAALNLRDEFISIAAHELRTPVTGIKISAQLALRSLDEGNPDTERIVQYLLGIVVGANRLALLMNDLMDVSRMRSGELQLHLAPVDIKALVKTAVQRYVETGCDEHHVTIHLPSSPMVASVDAMRLEQILDNLFVQRGQVFARRWRDRRGAAPRCRRRGAPRER
jgi:signal transduction histidine kinase